MKAWVLLVSLLVLCIAIGKIAHAICYPFWNKQPVFLHLNLSQWLRRGSIIDESRPNKNDRFYDRSIFVRSIDDCVESDIIQVLKFLEENYSPLGDFTYTPSLDTFKATFVMATDSYIATMSDKDGGLIGCITSRPAKCRLGKKTVTVNYIDHLCIKKKSRNKGLAPRLITTLSATIRKRTACVTCLFKREGASTPFVPLTCVISAATQAPIGPASAENSIVKLNVREAAELLQNVPAMEKYNCIAYTSPLSTMSALQEGIYSVYRANSGSIFVFRSNEVKSRQPVEECMFSLKSNRTDRAGFFRDYCDAVRSHRGGKYIIVVDGIGDSAIIQQESEKVSVPLEKSYAKYYLFNYVEYPHPCNRVAMLI
jgi:hypothetical protein